MRIAWGKLSFRIGIAVITVSAGLNAVPAFGQSEESRSQSTDAVKSNAKDPEMWIALGSQEFRGKSGEGHFTGLKAENIGALALKPENADARCSRITVRFGTGFVRALSISDQNLLSHDVFFKLDLPGDRRDLKRLYMRCRPVNQTRVKIGIYFSR